MRIGGIPFLAALLFTASLRADVMSFAGNLRTDANFTNCGTRCTLGAGNTDGDYAQWAAVEAHFRRFVAFNDDRTKFSKIRRNPSASAIGCDGFSTFWRKPDNGPSKLLDIKGDLDKLSQR